MGPGYGGLQNTTGIRLTVRNFAISEMNFIEKLREIQADRAGERAQELNLSNFSEDYINSAIKKLPNIRAGPLDIEKLKAMYIHS